MAQVEPLRDAGGRPVYAAEFAAGLLDPDRPTPALVAGPEGKGTKKRYAVYRNNVTLSLVEALAANFPATERITGRDFFRTMARFHVRATPPRSPLLFEYGRAFPDFIAGYEHARSMPWLADVARIERAWLDVWHAADAAPLAPRGLAAVSPERLADTTLTPHPATRIVRSQYPAITIFAANRRDGPTVPVAASDAEDALITRPDLNVTVRLLPPGGATFLARLSAGAPLGVAAAEALTECPGFDLPGNLRGMVESGAFVVANTGG